MGLIKEPENVDLIVNSKSWTEEELAELSAIIKKRPKRNQDLKDSTNTCTQDNNLEILLCVSWRIPCVFIVKISALRLFLTAIALATAVFAVLRALCG